MNRLSTAGFVLPSIYMGFRMFVLLGTRSGDVSSILWKVRGRIVPYAHRYIAEQFCLTPPRHSAVRSDATRPWYVRVFDSTGLHRISRVRASGETLKRRFYDPLEGTRDLSFLAEQVYWHPTLPDPARLFRRAPRPEPPVVCPGLGFDK